MKNYFFLILIIFSGCYSNQKTIVNDLNKYPEYNIKNAVTYDNELIEFYPSTKPYIQDSLLYGITKKLDKVSIPLKDIKEVTIEKFDYVGSCLTAAAIPVAVVGLIALLKESCPYIYTWNGSRYLFEGEPYGGAICEALKRVDYARLDSLTAIDGKYKLLLTNEVYECQYTDEFKFLVFDHSENISVLPDVEGNFYEIKDRIRPAKVLLNNKKEITEQLSQIDNLTCQSDFFSFLIRDDYNLKDTLILEFDIPEKQSSINLIYDVSTTLWGSYMLKIMGELRGRELAAWHSSLNNPYMSKMLDEWNRREEVYRMGINVWMNDRWEKKGEIYGGGPFISEERTVKINTEGLEGNKLKIMFTVPAAYWRLNYFAAAVAKPITDYMALNPLSVVSHQAEEIKNILYETDSDYYAMPDSGNVAFVEFTAPPKESDKKRTIFAKVSGYYTIYLDDKKEPDNEKIQLLTFEPGYPVKLAVDEYRKWNKIQTSLK